MAKSKPDNSGQPEDETGASGQSADLGLGGPDESGEPDNNSGDDKPGDKPGDSEPALKPKINLYRFLQLRPQKKGIEALLVSKFRNEAKTENEWEDALAALLAAKTK